MFRVVILDFKRKGRHVIRINNPWRICFRQSSAGTGDVEIVDYH